MHQKERLDVKRANKKRKINKKCSVVECKDYREELDYLKKQSFILSSIDGKVWKRKWRWSAYVYEIGVIIKGLKERLCLLWFRSKSNYCFLKVLQRSWELKKWKIDERLHPCHVLKGNDGRYSRLKSFAKINIWTEEALWICCFKRKSASVDFIQNEEIDEDDNQNWFGSKLIVTWSVSIRCYGLTVFENELMIENPSFLL